MSENITQFPKSFVSYPTDRLSAKFDNREQVSALLSDLEQLGLDVKDIDDVYVLDGPPGAEAMDIEGEDEGTLGMLSRALRAGVSSAERDKFVDAHDHLLKGGLAVAVHAEDEELRKKYIEVYKKHGAEDIMYTALFYIESIH